MNSLRSTVGRGCSAALLLGALLIAGCSASDAEPDATPSTTARSTAPAGATPSSTTAEETSTAAAARTVEPILVNSVLSTGPNRFTLAFADADGALIEDAEASLSFFPLAADGSRGELLTEETLQNHHVTEEPHAGDHGAGEGQTLVAYYATSVDFPQAGKWQVVMNVSQDGEEHEPITATFDVFEDPPHPTVGEVIPRTSQRVLADVEELSEIDTSQEPDEALHEQTVAQALDLGRPMVIGFATPAFCETRMCGPLVEGVLRPLDEQYAEQIEVIHIEPFDIAKAREGELVTVPAMSEWGLTTEPWLFVADEQGQVVARFEGPVTLEEVDVVLQELGVGAG